MSPRITLAILLSAICSVFIIVGTVTAAGAPTSPSINVSSTAGPVGAKITVSGAGYTPSTSLLLEWNAANASWVVTGNPPQVTGTKIVPFEQVLESVQTNSSGAFTVQLTVPSGFGGQHFLQVYASNGTALSAKAVYTLEPSFHISPSSGPAGTPITVTATGLGDGLYSTSYHLYWDDSYVGYMTALTTDGSTNFTIYASGSVGVHYVQVYQGYPGPGYLNPQQGPPSSETQSIFPPLIPYLTEFNVTSSQVLARATTSGSGSVSTSYLGGDILATTVAGVLIGGAGSFLIVSKRDPQTRRALARSLQAVIIVALLVVAGVALYEQFGQPHASSGTSSSSVQSTVFTPQATVVRPSIAVPTNNATTGPRINITPDIAAVGDTITVNGNGFASNSTLPLTWSTRQGNNLHGYELADEPLKNVTTNSQGSFSFTMKVPPDLGGIHYIAAGNLTPNSNGTLFLERSCLISPTEAPVGTPITVACMGVGWDFNTNIIAVDYDNSYFGYACGFNSGGNATVTLIATGTPGIQTVDVYPSVWWGTSNYYNQSLVEYRYPLLTPQDHPELMPSFHFSFLLTSNSSGTASQGAAAVNGLAGIVSSGPLLGIVATTLIDPGNDICRRPCDRRDSKR